MSDPKRWMDLGSGSSDVERELLDAGLRSGLPTLQKQQIWSALLQATLAAPPAVQQSLEAGSNAGQAASLKLLGVAGKLALGVGVVGALAVGAHVTFAPPATPKSSSGLRAAAPPTLSASPTPSADPPMNAAVPAAPSASVGGVEPAPNRAAGSPQLRQTQLREESLAVLEIRRVLRSGNAAAALALLEQARTRFTRPVLGQEREALTIEALARSGSTSAARRRAARFLRAYPESPHAADIRAFTSEK